MIGRRIFGIGLTLLLLTAEGWAQKPTFEVAKVRLNKSGAAGGGIAPRGNRLFVTNMPLRSLVLYAYSAPRNLMLNAQVVGLPDWAVTDRFDVEAKQEGDAPLVPGSAEARVMLQALLEERFQLKMHREMRDLPVYNLVLTKKGPKPSDDQTPPDPRQASIIFSSLSEQSPPLARGAMRIIAGPSSTTLIASAIAIPMLVQLLQGNSDRIVVDKTGFDKLIDAHLEFSQNLAVLRNEGPLQAPPESAISLFTALEEAGLKLEPAKAPMEVLVIDDVQHSSEN